MLNNAIFLEPINIFLYTWRFLNTLETEEKNPQVKIIYRWVSKVTLVLLPLAFIATFTALVLIDPFTFSAEYPDRATHAVALYYHL